MSIKDQNDQNFVTFDIFFLIFTNNIQEIKQLALTLFYLFSGLFCLLFYQ